ncbi:MAG: DUF4105 domain-containing protein [Planctomycetota bacterium]
MAATIVAFLVSLPLVLWVAGALYYDLGGGSVRGAALAIAWIGATTLLLVIWRPAWKPMSLLLLVFCLVLRWWFTLRPSQHRNWDPYFARLPRIEMEGDQIVIKELRNAEYRGVGDGQPKFEDRSYRLSQLCAVDALILQWGSPWMSHPMFVFDFGQDGRLCISIEVRYRIGQQFNLLRSLYRQQELMYVVSDERDAILRRTKYLEGHDLYLYRINARQMTIRQFFFEYANSVNALADAPRWYHGMTANCTTSIYAQGRGRMQWDWSMLFNGALDRLVYDRQLIDQRLPFDELKTRSWINEIANRAPVDRFGDYLRQELVGYRLSVGDHVAVAPEGENRGDE